MLAIARACSCRFESAKRERHVVNADIVDQAFEVFAPDGVPAECACTPVELTMFPVAALLDTRTPLMYSRNVRHRKSSRCASMYSM